MPGLRDRIKGWFRRRRRPLTVDEYNEVANWVNEGGAYDPAGPPPIAERSGEDDPRTGPSPLA